MDKENVNTLNNQFANLSNWQFEEVLNHVHIGFFKKDLINNKYLSLSESLPKIYGYGFADFYRNPNLWYDVILEEDRYITDIELLTLRSGKKSNAQYRIRHSDQSVRWVEVKTFPLFEDGVLSCVDGVIYDITTRKEAELETMRAKQFSECIINSLPGIFYLFDKNGTYLKWNDNFEKVTGYSYEEISGSTAGSYIHKDDQQRIRETISNVFKNGYDEVEARLVKKSGDIAMYYFNGRRVQIQGKTYLAGMGIDISKRKEAEDNLRKNERMLSCIIDSIPQSIFWKDHSGRFIGGNSVFAQLAGLGNIQSIVGKTDYDFPWIKEADKYRRNDLRVMETQVPQLHQVESLMRQNGQLTWLETSKIPLHDEKDQVYGVLVVIDDITEKKLKEDALKKLNDDLIQKNIGLTDFSYIVSHNLRAPIAKVLGLSSLFDRFEPNSDLNREIIEHISNEVNNLDTIVKDLNTILANQNSAGKLMEAVTLKDIFEESKSLYAEEIEVLSATVECNFEQAKSLKTIKSYIQSVFNNLISNSLRHTLADRKPEITVRSFTTAESLAISFKDNGPGFDLKRHGHKIFGMYNNFQPGSTGGKGIGLRLVKTQIEAIGGQIQVKSSPGNGSEFTVYLPAANLSC